MAWKKKTYYHGTSADALPGILKNGLGGYQKTLWYDSHRGNVYLWDDEGCRERECGDGFSNARYSAEVACAVAKDCRIVILEIQLRPNQVFEDMSGQNMADQGAVCTNEIIPIRCISKVYISQDIGILKSLLARWYLDMPNANQDFGKLQRLLTNKLKDCHLYPEDIEDVVEWKEFTISELRSSLKTNNHGKTRTQSMSGVFS